MTSTSEVPADGWHIRLVDVVNDADREAIASLADEARGADGFAPLNEQTALHLIGRHPGVTHFLAHGDAGSIVGYAQVEVTTTPTDAATVELVVSTRHRRLGIGSALAGRVLAAVASRPVQAWAHGTTAAAEAFASHTGFEPIRRLLQLGRPIDDQNPLVPPAATPVGLRIRTFVPGDDEDAWIRVNSAAFASHPEQGRWTRDDLVAREIEGWFDPAGFFLAETTTEPARVVGFHWTKQDGGAGEVYVLGIDPSAQGSGLGRILLRTGLAYLRSRGCSVVDLYVEADNAAARRLYEREGFAVHVTDTMYRQTSSAGRAPEGSSKV